MSWNGLWLGMEQNLKIEDVSGVNFYLVPDLITCHKCGKTMQDDPGGEDRWWHLHITPVKDESTCPDCQFVKQEEIKNETE